MARKDAAARRGEGGGGEAPRASLYGQVTGRIVAGLEVGRLPSVQSWDDAAAAPGLPRNASWPDVLRAHDRAIFRAASLAGRAADYLPACRDAAPGGEVAA